MSQKDQKPKSDLSAAEALIAEAMKSVENREKAKQADTTKEGLPEVSVDIQVPAAGAMSAPPAADKEKGEFYDKFVRVSADFDNFRKRHQREKEDWRRYGAEAFIRAFLPTIDNMERAIKQCPNDPAFESMRQGLRMVQEQMFRNLQAEGVTAVDPLGQSFDPLIHEAVATREDASVAPGTVVEVHHKGYKLWDRLIRAAMVTVSTQPVTTAETSKTGDGNS